MVRLWGLWCGPNWTAGQVKPAEDATKADARSPCIDNLDCACKEHDLNIAQKGANYDGDTRLLRVAQRILNDPMELAFNPDKYAAAEVVAIAMSLVRWTREQ